MQKVTTFLWYDNQAEEAAKFYVSLFKNSKITGVTRYGDAGPGPKGTAMTVSFTLDGVEFTALNGGPIFKFTEAISLYVNCTSQEEADALWEELSEGGDQSQCGWLKDRYGLSWQIIPSEMMTLINGKDPKRSAQAMQAMLKMQKIDLKKLREAYNK